MDAFVAERKIQNTIAMLRKGDNVMLKRYCVKGYSGDEDEEDANGRYRWCKAVLEQVYPRFGVFKIYGWSLLGGEWEFRECMFWHDAIVMGRMKKC